MGRQLEANVLPDDCRVLWHYSQGLDGWTIGSMHDGRWHDNWGGGSWWLMAIMMIAFWAGIIWIAVTLLRRGEHHPQPHAPGGATPPRPTPQEILAERLARGEIEPDDYRQRLDALQHLKRDE